MKKPLAFSTILVIILSLSGCNPTQPTQGGVPIGVTVAYQTETPDTTGAYPAEKTPGTYVGNVYPADPKLTQGSSTPFEKTASPIVIPAPDTETATLMGLISSVSTGQPLVNVTLYIAEKTPLGDSKEYVYSFQEKSSPHSLTDTAGQFIITNITPGAYVVLLTTPFGNYLALDSNNQEIHLDLIAGDVIDLEEVFVNWP